MSALKPARAFFGSFGSYKPVLCGCPNTARFGLSTGACEREHNTRLASPQDPARRNEAAVLAERIFNNCRSIYAMLFDLQVLGLVRIIEARD